MPRKKSKRKTKNTKLKWYIAAFSFLLLFIAYTFYLKSQPYKIGVLLPLTGPDANHYQEMVEWAKEEYEKAAPNGKKIEFVYKDIGSGEDIHKLADSLLKDPRIRIVIGPNRSANMMNLAPTFIKAKKLLLSPTTTAADIYRAFEGKDYIWRTVQSDAAQIRTIMHELQKKQVGKIALIYDPSPYGKTFYDWTGFFATEAGINLTSIQAINHNNPDYPNLITKALTQNPQYIVTVTYPEDTVAIKRELDKRSTFTKLFLTDSSQVGYVTQNLGNSAEGLESTGVAFDPDSNFETLYLDKMKEEPHGFTASVFDAGILAILTAIRNDQASPIPLPFISEDISNSFKKLIYSKSSPKIASDLKEIISEIKQGNLPKYKGYSSSLDFDQTHGVDPLDSFYSYQIVRNNKFQTLEVINSNTSTNLGVYNENSSVAKAQGSLQYVKLANAPSEYQLKPKNKLKAVIVATSAGWENYRHQSDAAAIYQLLKQNGLSDEDIILFMIDDIPQAMENNPKNSLFHIVDGKNNYQDIEIDYRGVDVTEKNLTQALLSLESDENTNVLLYIVNHGGDVSEQTAQALGGDLTTGSGVITFTYANSDSEALFTSDELGKIVDKMSQDNLFRQMLIVVEACFSGAMGVDINQKGVLFMSAANASEVSYGANYDPNLKQWLADNFTYQFIAQARKNPDQSIENFYLDVYQNVPGSHVTLLNYQNFGNISKTPISEFISP